MKLKLFDLETLIKECESRKINEVRYSTLQKQQIAPGEITWITHTLFFSIWDKKNDLLITIDIDVWSEMAVNLEKDKNKVKELAALEEKQIDYIKSELAKKKIMVVSGMFEE